MRLPLHNVIPLTKIIFRTVAKYPVPLLKAFAWPALVFLFVPWAGMFLATVLPVYGIFFVPGLLMGFLASLTLVGTVRYLDLDEHPPLDPRRIAWPAVARVSLVLIPLYVTLYTVIAFVALSQFAAATVGETPITPTNLFLTALAQFVLAIIALGVVYPLTGPIALLERFELKSSWRMIRDSLPALLMLAALLLLIVICGYAAYEYAISAPRHWMFRAMLSVPHGFIFISFLAFLLNLPLLFFIFVLPAIAVAHLTQGLGRRILGSVMVLASAPESQT